jgi:hypothetical protein
MKRAMAAGIMMMMALSGCSGTGTIDAVETPTRTPSPTPKAFSVVVDFRVYQAGLDTATDVECWGRGGYSDIGPSTQVKITDATGKVVAFGTLGAGKTADSVGGASTSCAFKPTISGIPLDAPAPLGVEVSHRGVIQFQPKGDPTVLKLVL